MRKFILFFVLLTIFLSIFVFMSNAILLKKKSDVSENTDSDAKNSTESAELSPSFYTDYSLEKYDKSLSEKRVVVLYFTSNWCGECILLDQELTEIFKSLDNENIAGFKIHILDSDTTTETDALSQKFDVTKEMTLVFLDKNGAVSNKTVGSVNSKVILDEIKKAGDM